MRTRVALALSLFCSVAAFGQLDPLNNLAGTTPALGTSPWVRTGNGSLTFFHGFDVHVTYLTQTGPEDQDQENETFSTNWAGAGAQLALGDRAFVLARGRVSLEPFTMDDRYPQFFQFVPEDGLVDHMRPHDLFGEIAVQAGYRPTANTLVSVYGALVGQPALGAPPAQLRSSGIDFAEAPFTYEMTETFHDSSKVVTAGFATRFFTIEASSFADTVTTGDHTEIPDGDMDSQSARLTLTPTPNVAIQVSRGNLAEDTFEREISSASLTYAGRMMALTALWTSRDYPNVPNRETETAYGVEVAIRGGRSTFMGRVEHIDRPAGFPFVPGAPAVSEGLTKSTHYTAGYILDFLPQSRYRVGAGVNIDYRTQTRELEEHYGHKPQGIYAFIRFRT